jgi:hypothetical protein
MDISDEDLRTPASVRSNGERKLAARQRRSEVKSHKFRLLAAKAREC